MRPRDGKRPNGASEGGGGRRGRERPLRGRRAALLAGAIGVLALGVVARVLSGMGAAGESGFERVVDVPAPPPTVAVRDTLGSGQTLAALLAEQGFSGPEVHRLVETVREYENPRYLRPGIGLTVERDMISRQVRGLRLALDADRRLTLEPGDGGWRAALDSVPVTRDTIVVAGLIHSSLYDARLYGDTARLVPGEEVDLTYEVARIFQWRIDFYRDLRPGDAYRVVIARQLRPDGSLRSARVLGAEFRNGDRQLWAVRFDVEGRSGSSFYGLEGKSLETMFLQAPLEYTRVTSGFSRGRYHPVLNRRRAHLGIDYGASPGSPVRATGAGVVTRAGWWGGYGRIVELRHPGPYRTRYAHLSRIASGLGPGDRVDQGQVIGRVGSSGLATGPHLHYEFLERGRQRDPSELELPPRDPVPAGQRQRFRDRRDRVVSLLMRVPLPSVEQREQAATDAAS